MELLLGLRGAKDDVDKTIRELQCMKLTYEFKGDWKAKSGDTFKKGQKVAMEVGVKPIQLYMISFPKEHKDLMLTTILGTNDGLSKYQWLYKWLKWPLKFMKMQPIGEYDKTKAYPLHRMNTDFIGLAIKEDKEHEFGEGI